MERLICRFTAGKATQAGRTKRICFVAAAAVAVVDKEQGVGIASSMDCL